MSGYAPGAGLGPVTLVSCLKDRMDAFVVGLDGQVYTSSWWPGGTWSDWRAIGGITTAPCARITAISRMSGAIDVFAVAKDGHVYQASSWVSSITAVTGYAAWRCLDKAFTTVLHAHISAVYTSAKDIYLFAVDHQGHVYEALWIERLRAWTSWMALSDYKNVVGPGAPVVPPGAPIGASWSGTSVDLFVVDNEGYISWCSGFVPSVTDWYLPPVDHWDLIWFGSGLTPRTAVTAARHWTGALCLFFTAPGGLVAYGWNPGGRGWTWGLYYDITTAERAPVTVAAIPGSLQFNLLVTGLDGRVWHATSTIGTSGWSHGWTRIESLTTDPAMAIGAASRSAGHLDIAVPQSADGRTMWSSWSPVTQTFSSWTWMAQGVTGMEDPQVGDWKYVGDTWWLRGSDWSNEAQGMTTDGTNWYLSTNGTRGVVRFSGDFGPLPGTASRVAPAYDYYIPARIPGATNTVAVPVHGTYHLGAADCFAGWLYVPLQDHDGNDGLGVWAVSTDFSLNNVYWPNFVYAGTFSGPYGFPSSVACLVPVESTTGAHFALCAVNPLNGRLYSATRDARRFVAFDKETVTARPEDDIGLAVPSVYAGAQGAVFTRGGRLIVVDGSPGHSGGLFCFSAVTGQSQGVKDLGMYGHDGLAGAGLFGTGSETEGVTVRTYGTGSVHVLEINNNWGNDDAYLHAYSVPVPSRL